MCAFEEFKEPFVSVVAGLLAYAAVRGNVHRGGGIEVERRRMAVRVWVDKPSLLLIVGSAPVFKSFGSASSSFVVASSSRQLLDIRN